MAKQWNTEMQERFDKLQAAADEFRGRFDAIDIRFKEVDQRFEAVDRRFDVMDQRFEAVDRRFDEFETRILRAFKIQTEDIRADLQKVAEGFGGMLERMERNITEMRREWAETRTDHESILGNHERRITTLERAKNS